jgi:TgpA N-terminal domain
MHAVGQPEHPDTCPSLAHAITIDITPTHQSEKNSFMNPTTRTSRSTVLKWSIALTLYYILATVFFMDIGLHDETTFYLSQKDSITLSSFWTQAEYGPLYAVWYKLISLVVWDNIVLYFVSWALLVTLSVQLMRITTESVGNIIPILVTLGLPMFKVWPYVGMFAGALILFGFIVARSQKSIHGAIIVSALSMLLVGLARPEFLYGPAMLLVGCASYILVARKRPDVKTALVCIVVAVLGIVISRNSDTGRGAVAFEQHFNLRASERGELGDEFPWTSKHARKVFFQNSTKKIDYRISDYVKSNPVEVVKHVARNVIDPRTLLLAFACAAVAVALYRAGQPLGALYVTFMSLPPLLGCTLIYPRSHYIVSILLTLVAGACIAASHFLRGSERGKRLEKLRKPITTALVLFVLVFPIAHKAANLPYKHISKYGIAAMHPVVATALELREMEEADMFKKPLVMFEAYGGIHHYLRQPWRWIPEFHVLSSKDFLDLIRNHQASAFLLNRHILDYYNISDEEVDKAFREGGYQARQCMYLDCIILLAPK